MDIQDYIKNNPDLLTALIITGKINKQAIRKAENHLKKCQLRGQSVNYRPEKASTKQGKASLKQLQARQDAKDKMQTAKQDMIDHIKNEIGNNAYSVADFINDPEVYFESRVMGNHYNNVILRKAVINYFKNEYLPF
jgi:hypothetical protein